MGRRSPESDLPHMYIWMDETVYMWIYVLIVQFLISDTSDGKKVETKMRRQSILDSL